MKVVAYPVSSFCITTDMGTCPVSRRRWKWFGIKAHAKQRVEAFVVISNQSMDKIVPVNIVMEDVSPLNVRIPMIATG
ncbi:hypothetical protein GMSM_46790 [Geomonas sp. Red276]